MKIYLLLKYRIFEKKKFFIKEQNILAEIIKSKGGLFHIAAYRLKAKGIIKSGKTTWYKFWCECFYIRRRGRTQLMSYYTFCKHVLLRHAIEMDLFHNSEISVESKIVWSTNEVINITWKISSYLELLPVALVILGFNPLEKSWHYFATTNSRLLLRYYLLLRYLSP